MIRSITYRYQIKLIFFVGTFETIFRPGIGPIGHIDVCTTDVHICCANSRFVFNLGKREREREMGCCEVLDS